jgi:hypothetical protein
VSITARVAGIVGLIVGLYRHILFEEGKIGQGTQDLFQPGEVETRWQLDCCDVGQQ